VLDILIEVAATLMIPVPTGRRKARKQAEAFAAGETVTFAGSVLGELPYCRATIGFLSASRNALAASPTEAVEAVEFNRRPIPVERLALVRVRGRQRSDPRAVQPWWQVAECRDGESTVRLSCAPEHMALLTTTLRQAAFAR